MKTLTYTGEGPSHMSGHDYYKQLSELLDFCYDFPCFQYEGRYFAGYKVSTVKEYLRQNSSKSFYVWLIDNGLEITQ